MEWWIQPKKRPRLVVWLTFHKSLINSTYPYSLNVTLGLRRERAKSRKTSARTAVSRAVVSIGVLIEFEGRMGPEIGRKYCVRLMWLGETVAHQALSMTRLNALFYKSLAKILLCTKPSGENRSTNCRPICITSVFCKILKNGCSLNWRSAWIRA